MYTIILNSEQVPVDKRTAAEKIVRRYFNHPERLTIDYETSRFKRALLALPLGLLGDVARQPGLATVADELAITAAAVAMHQAIEYDLRQLTKDIASSQFFA